MMFLRENIVLRQQINMAFKSIVKNILSLSGIDVRKANEGLAGHSIRRALSENGLCDMVSQLRKIVPDISNQEESERDFFNAYWELKRRGLQSFQCSLMIKALSFLTSSEITVVDIGDSAGTHMLYLKELAKEQFTINTLSVNLDPNAIEKIKARGLMALLCRAEDVDMEGYKVDMFTSFEMVEHLHNPAIFFHRLATKTNCKTMVITVPYLKRSRVGLHHIRNNSYEVACAENEHVFELSPEDWTLLMLHAGWKVVYSEINYQYARKLPLISQLFSWYWKKTDYEGFWGAILEKDTTFSDRYMDWEN
jgi:2-polyprenyl-3-methyl-5-hydroxy-6-metoxy-1,4-benzoquinol methylase